MFLPVLAAAIAASPPLAAPDVWTPAKSAILRARRNYYPLIAQRSNVEGHTVVECRLIANGLTTACKLVAEDPAGFGFGDAALKIAASFQFDMKAAPAGVQWVRFPIWFSLPRNPGGVRAKVLYVQGQSIAGQAEVSCQAFSEKLDNCFVVSAEPPELKAVALRAAAQVPPGPNAPPGLRFILPLEFVASAVTTP